MLGAPLTPRERAVLAAVERRLTNPEIAAELFISVRTVESHIASLRRKLDADTRADLVAASRERRESAIPIPANPLRGRGRDLGHLTDLLRTTGQVTVIGPGGVGKTRLALETVRADDDRVPLIVELEHAVPGDVVRRISRELELEAAPSTDLTAAVSVALAAQPYLVVLDNADHVGAATAAVVTSLRARTPGLRVLVTSRTPLGSADEVVYPLSPLGTDGVDAPAMALLSDRLGVSGRVLSSAELDLADHIARRLDGLPLALELAASAARHFPLSELAVRLDHGFGALDRATPEGRHRSLETAFEWSWDLLDDDEKDLLRRLAALPRTFDLELAAAVARPGVEGTVLRLLDRSLVVPANAFPGRWRMLAVMREFVAARTDALLTREVLARHAVYIDGLAARFVETARTDSSLLANTRSTMLCPEVNAALRWSLDERQPVALTLTASLSVGVEQYGSDADSLATLARAAAGDEVLARASAEQLLRLGNALSFFDVERVQDLARRALQIADSDEALRAAHQLAGVAEAYGAHPDAALAHLDLAEELALAQGHTWDAASIRQMRGVALRTIALRDGSDDDLDRALAAFASAMRAYALAGDETHVNNVRFMMALTAAESGRSPSQAALWAEECAQYAERISNGHELAHARLVFAALRLDEPGDLPALVEEFRHLGDLRCVHRALLLRADRAPHDGVAFLREAADISAAAGDVARQAEAVRRLAAALHASGDEGGALAALDRLARIAGTDAALAACPDALRSAFSASAA